MNQFKNCACHAQFYETLVRVSHNAEAGHYNLPRLPTIHLVSLRCTASSALTSYRKLGDQYCDAYMIGGKMYVL